MANLNIANVSLETQRAVEQFLFHQAEVADERRWDEWLGLFTRDGKYWMPAEAGQEKAEGVPKRARAQATLAGAPPNRSSH